MLKYITTISYRFIIDLFKNDKKEYKCLYCETPVLRIQLWCSAECQEDYENE